MTEEFIHYIWQFRLFKQHNLKTLNGEALEIIKPGTYNRDAGPDFFTAKIKIGSTEWVGNVEIHTRASDWEKHRHQYDKAYDNIILHVVFENDKSILDKNNIPIPTLVLKELIEPTLIQNYETIKSSSDWIPCEKSIQRVPEFMCSTWLERLTIERLEEKSKTILTALQLNQNNWEECFYQQLAHNFGFKINAVPFEMLAKSLPNSTLAKHKNSLLQLEALFYGNAGMLEKQYSDKYLQTLQNEYQFLSKKFALKPMDVHLWKFLRLRPANFPSIRIAQFSALVHQSEHLFSKILTTNSLDKLQKFLNVSVSDYWKTHYMLDKNSPFKNKSLGKSAADNLIINTIVPFLFVYGKYKQQEEFAERALLFLEKIKPEKNHITDKFSQLGMNIDSASRSQAFIQLKNLHCAKKDCLQCAIGNYLLKN